MIQTHNFVRWVGWAKSSDVRRDHLQPGDEVFLDPRGEISPQGDLGKQRNYPPVVDKVGYLTKRGVRRLLFRSNHPRAIQYTDQILDLLDVVDDAQKVGIDVVNELKERVAQLQGEMEGTDHVNGLLFGDYHNEKTKVRILTDENKRLRWRYTLATGEELS